MSRIFSISVFFFTSVNAFAHTGGAAAPSGTVIAGNIGTTIPVQEIGYVFIYLSYDNDTGNDVYFDDLKITVQESNVIQVNNYYPFGMKSYSWLRNGETDNAYLFQGKELIAQTGWHDFGSRMYYADLGRWLAGDPQKQFSSPYLAMGNVPMMGRDPNGEWFGWDDIVIAVVGGISNVVSNWDAITHGKGGFLKGLEYFGAGAVGADVGWNTMNPELGFAVAGALTTAADQANHVGKTWVQSFITGGMSALQGYEVGESIEEGEAAAELSGAEKGGIDDGFKQAWKDAYGKDFDKEYMAAAKKTYLEDEGGWTTKFFRDFSDSRLGKFIMPGLKEGIKGYGKDGYKSDYDGWNFFNDFAMEKAKGFLGMETGEYTGFRSISFSMLSGNITKNIMMGFSKNLLTQFLKIAEGKETDSYESMLVDSLDDPFQSLGKDFGGRWAFIRLCAGQ
ncbi:MAG: hypothetical protein OJF59_000644 [Cytophagales bacterium]|nr:hypothetical protein [Bacteroidota bacterium]MBS1981352.1 hypothetical protein [Bacteroidota bacterium]WHZ06891.1 MAG: hypothetical protein OJF59_000644 [Cytophagales bacterium]